jgi:hypothetical protein
MKTFLLIIVLGLAAPLWSQPADVILINGKILTVDAQFSTREAVAIRDGRSSPSEQLPTSENLPAPVHASWTFKAAL